MTVTNAEPWVVGTRGSLEGTAAGTALRETLGKAFSALSAGDPDALEALYDATADRIYGLALWRTGSAEDASDVVQEVFLRIVEARSRLGSVKEPFPWLLGLAHHVAIDVARRSKRRATVPLDGVPFLAAAEHDHASPIDAARVTSLLALLPAAQRDAIYLRHFEECTFARIGRITGVPAFTAASRYRLGIGKLRRFLEGRR
ncbi:MAG TPA: RNA polymerase sigma factor [Thermoanaerobaculia bacterium]|nr:RNA polymerase sigma factor [Thermoanaerobaculia bacterium]